MQLAINKLDKHLPEVPGAFVECDGIYLHVLETSAEPAKDVHGLSSKSSAQRDTEANAELF